MRYNSSWKYSPPDWTRYMTLELLLQQRFVSAGVWVPTASLAFCFRVFAMIYPNTVAVVSTQTWLRQQILNPAYLNESLKSLLATVTTHHLKKTWEKCWIEVVALLGHNTTRPLSSPLRIDTTYFCVCLKQFMMLLDWTISWKTLSVLKTMTSYHKMCATIFLTRHICVSESDLYWFR